MEGVESLAPTSPRAVCVYPHPPQPPAPKTKPVDPANSRVGLHVTYKCSQGKRVPVSPCYRNEPGSVASHVGRHNTGMLGCAAKGELSTRYAKHEDGRPSLRPAPLKARTKVFMQRGMERQARGDGGRGHGER